VALVAVDVDVLVSVARAVAGVLDALVSTVRADPALLLVADVVLASASALAL
jgi:hypothetical protein